MDIFDRYRASQSSGSGGSFYDSLQAAKARFQQDQERERQRKIRAQKGKKINVMGVDYTNTGKGTWHSSVGKGKTLSQQQIDQLRGIDKAYDDFAQQGVEQNKITPGVVAGEIGNAAKQVLFAGPETVAKGLAYATQPDYGAEIQKNANIQQDIINSFNRSLNDPKTSEEQKKRIRDYIRKNLGDVKVANQAANQYYAEKIATTDPVTQALATVDTASWLPAGVVTKAFTTGGKVGIRGLDASLGAITKEAGNRAVNVVKQQLGRNLNQAETRVILSHVDDVVKQQALVEANKPYVTIGKSKAPVSEDLANYIRNETKNIPSEQFSDKKNFDTSVHVTTGESNMRRSTVSLEQMAKDNPRLQQVLDKYNQQPGSAVSEAQGVTSAAEKATAEQLNNTLIDASKQATSRYERSKLGKAVQKIKETLNVSHELRKIDNLAAAKHGKLNKVDTLENAYDGVLNSNQAADILKFKKMSTGNSAAEVMQKHASDIEQFNNYRNALSELYARSKGVKFRTSLTKSDLESIVKAYEAQNKGARQDIYTLNEAINEARKHARANGAITSELDAKLGNSKIFTPVQAAKPDVPKPKMGGKTVTRGEQQFARELTGPSDAPILTNFDPILTYIDTAYKNAAEAKLSQLLLKRQKEGLIKDAIIKSEPGAKPNKRILRDYSKATLQEAKKVQKKVQITAKQARVLASEINQLNKRGVQAALKKERYTPKQATKTVTVKTVKPLMIDNAPKTLDDLTQSYPVKQILKEEYGPGAKAVEQMAADVHNGGYTQLMALNPRISKATAESIAGQILKKPTFKPGSITVTEGKIGRSTDPVTIIKNMIDKSPAELNRIQKSIALREPRLAAKLEQVRLAQDNISALKSEAKGYRQASAEIVDDPTTNTSFIRGMDNNGEAYSMELPPDLMRLLRGTDISPSSPFMKGMLNVQRTFQTFWSGFVNPVFQFISTPLYDVAANVNALVDSPKAFLQTISPDSFYTAVRGLKNSDEFQIALREAGAAPQGASMMPQEASKSVESIISKRNFASRTGYLMKNPKELIHAIDQVGGKVSNATRTRLARGYYKDALKRGLSEQEALGEAAFAYNNLAPNFNRVNALARDGNAFIPYFTASVAGNRSLWQPILKNPGRAAAIYGGIAATFVGAAANNLSTEAGQEFYKQMREAGKQHVLDNNFIIVLPTASYDPSNGKWSGIIKIPIAPEYRYLNQLAHNSTQQATTGESDLSPTQVASALFNTMTGGVPDSASQGPGIVSTIRIAANADPFSSVVDSQPLVNPYTAAKKKSDQVYPWTSDAGKVLSNIAGYKISPIQADAILRQFGSAGQMVTGTDLQTQVANKFYGATSQSLSSRAYDATSDYNNLSQKMKDAGGGIDNARSIAEDWNKSVDSVINQVKSSDLSDAEKTKIIDGLKRRKASTKDENLKKRLE